MSTLAYLCILIVSLSLAAAVIAVLTDRLIERDRRRRLAGATR